MRPVLTADEYRRVDKAYTGDLSRAMDRAGHAVALAAVRAGAGYGARVTVLTGPGNNGGDGYVAARYLAQRGAEVEVHALAPPATPIARAAAERARAEGVRVGGLGAPVSVDVVVDALFGGGAREGFTREVNAWMDSHAPVIAVDYPTGLDPDTGKVGKRSFRAVETVTFSTLKTGHVLGQGPDVCGRVTVVDIGISGGEPSMFVAGPDDAPRPDRPRRAHKWSAGAVLVVGGSEGIVGASAFAGRAALNFGAGTVVVGSPRNDIVQQIAPQLPNLTLVEALDGLDRFDVVVAGPGLAPSDLDSAYPLLAKAQKVVLDAGALTPEALERATDGADVVITPHDGEFARVAGHTAGTFAVRSFAAKHGITVLRKGNPTMVTDGGLPILVTSGGPELASIGTGDVLAGMLGALWARGLRPPDAAVSAAYWHGRAAGDLATRRTVTADRLVDAVAGYAW